VELFHVCAASSRHGNASRLRASNDDALQFTPWDRTLKGAPVIRYVS